MKNFKEIETLGSGSFGSVVHVKCKKTGKDFALKIFRKDLFRKGLEEVLKNEVEILKVLYHPNIVTYIDSFIDNDRACIQMELCEGGTLAKKIERMKERDNTIPIREVVVIFSQLCLAVECIHKENIIHRDIKPENIFFSHGQLKLGDFGVSKLLDSNEHYTETYPVGTPCYWAPEIVKKEQYNIKCDVWSMGCVLYKMVTGKFAFLGYRDKIIKGVYDPVPESVVPEIRDLIRQMLNVVATKRPSASQILEKPVLQNDAASSPGPTCQYDLILVGKTGNGKSSTGNTIIGRHIFKVSDFGAAETHETSVRYTLLDNDVVVKVVDTPGFSDTRINKDGEPIEVVKNLSQGFQYCPSGFHALILVLRYGARYTQEERDVVCFLKRLFRETVTRDHCILVFTNGEDFDRNYQTNKNMTFQKWCENQKGELRDLIDECKNRIVLFYNKEPDRRQESVKKLISLVEDIPKKCTGEVFDEIRVTRSQILKNNEIPEEIVAGLGVIMFLIDRLRQESYSPDMSNKTLQQIMGCITVMKSKIDQLSSGNNDIVKIRTIIESMQSEIDYYHNNNSETHGINAQNVDDDDNDSTPCARRKTPELSTATSRPKSEFNKVMAGIGKLAGKITEPNERTTHLAGRTSRRMGGNAGLATGNGIGALVTGATDMSITILKLQDTLEDSATKIESMIEKNEKKFTNKLVSAIQKFISFFSRNS